MDEDAMTETVILKYHDWDGTETLEEYWVPSGGGYVRRIYPTRPGTLGDQVCQGLGSSGSCLWARPEELKAVIRREHRRRLRRERS